MKARFTFNKTKDAPCMNCADRCVGCHSACERYKEYKGDLNNKNEIVKQNKEIECAIHDMTSTNLEKLRRNGIYGNRERRRGGFHRGK